MKKYVGDKKYRDLILNELKDDVKSGEWLNTDLVLLLGYGEDFANVKVKYDDDKIYFMDDNNNIVLTLSNDDIKMIEVYVDEDKRIAYGFSKSYDEYPEYSLIDKDFHTCTLTGYDCEDHEGYPISSESCPYRTMNNSVENEIKELNYYFFSSNLDEYISIHSGYEILYDIYNIECDVELYDFILNDIRKANGLWYDEDAFNLKEIKGTQEGIEKDRIPGSLFN